MAAVIENVTAWSAFQSLGRVTVASAPSAFGLTNWWTTRKRGLRYVMVIVAVRVQVPDAFVPSDSTFLFSIVPADEALKMPHSCQA